LFNAANSCFILQRKNRFVTTETENVKPVNKNFVEVNSNQQKPRNLIPRNYNQFMFTMLSSQEKWNLVFEKLIAAFDKLEDSKSKEGTPKN
jgi:hypothetical protein